MGHTEWIYCHVEGLLPPYYCWPGCPNYLPSTQHYIAASWPQCPGLMWPNDTKSSWLPPLTLSHLCLWPNTAAATTRKGPCPHFWPWLHFCCGFYFLCNSLPLCARALVAIHVDPHHFQSLSALTGQLEEKMEVSSLQHLLHLFTELA